jgi:nucleotide-binding universal stress UspA family protein
MKIQKILVPVDYSEDSQRALQGGASLAEKYGAKLLLLHVIPNAVDEVYSGGTELRSPTLSYYETMAPGVWAKHPIIIDRVDTAHTELRDLADKHLKDATPVQIKVAVGKPIEEILHVAREEQVDLIVMGTHGRTGVRHLVLGSVAEAVSRQAPCPVLTVRLGRETRA